MVAGFAVDARYHRNEEFHADRQPMGTKRRDDVRYEYRTWGRNKQARRILGKLACETTTEVVDDCYLLVDDEADVNAKVRGGTLKVKQLVGRRKGFEQWSRRWYRAVEAAPAPFDDLADRLQRDRERRGSSFDLAEAVDRLDRKVDADAVLVRKHRTRHRIGSSIRAEVTDMTIVRTGEVLRCIAIEGDDLDELTALRKRLGLKKGDNVAVHVALGADLDTD